MKEISGGILNFFDIDWEEVQAYFLNLFLTAAVTYLVIVILRFLLHQLFKRTSFLDEKKEGTIESVVRNTSNYILFAVILISAIRPIFGNLKELLVAGGIIAAVVGFGAQKLINDLLSGMFMIFERTIQKGDFVNINGEPEGGTVEELGFRVVKIRLTNGKLVTVPNGEIRKMVNGSVEVRRVFESVIVSFSENPGKVKTLLQEVCDELNEKHKGYLKLDPMTGNYVEKYEVYGLHSLDVSPIGYKFSITATVKDTQYLKAAQETKEVLAQKMYDNHILMPAQQIVMRQEKGFESHNG